MTRLRDPFDPDNRPPHWLDEDGNFGGWLSEAEIAASGAKSHEVSDDEADAISLAGVLAAKNAGDDDMIEF